MSLRFSGNNYIRIRLATLRALLWIALTVVYPLALVWFTAGIAFVCVIVFLVIETFVFDKMIVSRDGLLFVWLGCVFVVAIRTMQAERRLPMLRWLTLQYRKISRDLYR